MRLRRAIVVLMSVQGPAIASSMRVSAEYVGDVVQANGVRGRPATPPTSADIPAMTPRGRPANILWTVSMNAYVTCSDLSEFLRDLMG